MKRPLALSDVKSRLLGHFGTTPGQNFMYVHLNRLIKERELSMIYISGPGHGGPAIVAQVYMEGTYTDYYPQVTQDLVGMGRLFKQFSFPGGIPSHVAPETPGSMHEGGELGYSLSHAFGAVLDKPDLWVACCVGDGEAETGPLATSWHSNKFINPTEELIKLFEGYGYKPILVEGHEPGLMHPLFAKALDQAADEIQAIQKKARSSDGPLERPIWPMIIMRSPKGWTGPHVVDGEQIEDTYRSHQVPLSSPATNPEHLALLEEWLK